MSAIVKILTVPHKVFAFLGTVVRSTAIVTDKSVVVIVGRYLREFPIFQWFTRYRSWNITGIVPHGAFPLKVVRVIAQVAGVTTVGAIFDEMVSTFTS